MPPNAGHHADHAEPPDMHTLMNRDMESEISIVVDFDMSGDRDQWSEFDVIADPAVMSDVDPMHEVVIAADSSLRFRRRHVNSTAFAEYVAIVDNNPAVAVQVLRMFGATTDRAAVANFVSITHADSAGNQHVVANRTARTDMSFTLYHRAMAYCDAVVDRTTASKLRISTYAHVVGDVEIGRDEATGTNDHAICSNQKRR